MYGVYKEKLYGKFELCDSFDLSPAQLIFKAVMIMQAFPNYVLKSPTIDYDEYEAGIYVT